MTVWDIPKGDSYFRPILEADPRGFEIDHLKTAMPFCRRYRTALDGGAHIGTWTCELAKNFERVIAFEPADDTFECLQANTADLTKVPAEANVQLWKAALGQVERRVEIVDDPARQGNTGSRHVAAGNAVEMMAVDQLALTDLDFMKLDLEGYELFALKGAVQTLRRCKPVVLIEVKRFTPKRFGVDHEDAATFLLGMGYIEVARKRNDRVYRWG
jgi:FkbM family methyltransferase